MRGTLSHGYNAEEDFESKYDVHTLYDVIREIRDDSARNYLDHLPYKLKIHDFANNAHFKMVSNFAKDTGDYRTLSQTDMNVISLGISMAEKVGEFDKVKTIPKPLTEFQPRQFAEDYQKLEKELVSSDDEEEQEPEKSKNEDEDGFMQIDGNKRKGRSDYQ